MHKQLGTSKTKLSARAPPTAYLCLGKGEPEHYLYLLNWPQKQKGKLMTGTVSFSSPKANKTKPNH